MSVTYTDYPFYFYSSMPFDRKYDLAICKMASPQKS